MKTRSTVCVERHISYLRLIQQEDQASAGHGTGLGCHCGVDREVLAQHVEPGICSVVVVARLAGGLGPDATAPVPRTIVISRAWQI